MNSLTQTLICLIATLPAAYATSVLEGDTTGNSRGTDSVDIQSKRTNSAEVASGTGAIAVGHSNMSSGDNSVSLGMGNDTSASHAASVGLWNTADGESSVSFGYLNTVTADLGMAFGNFNQVHGPALSFEIPSGAFGFYNTVSAYVDASYAFGMYNTISATYATAFGYGITNDIAYSTMIGPSDAAKVTILSSGNVGIGTGDTAPTEKLHVVGNAKITGNLSVSGSFTPAGAVTLGNGQTLNLPSAGKINVNTTTPLGSIHVVPTGTIGAGGGDFTKAAFSTKDGSQILGIDPNQIVSTGADLYIQNTTHGIRLNAASATTGDDIVITTAGNVGIGTGTTTPTERLHVAGNLKVTGDISTSGRTALGNGSASGSNSLASGFNSTASGGHSTALGYTAQATGDYSVALGSGAWGAAIASGEYSFAAVGAQARGYQSVALGQYAVAQAANSTAIGNLNIPQGDATAWIPTDDLFVIGNSSHYYNGQSNAFVVHKNGNTRAAGTVEAKGGFRTPPMGDIAMGDFTAGPIPGGHSATAGSDPETLNAGLRYQGE